MAEYFSRFGGLWIDRTDQAAVARRIAEIPDPDLRTAIADFNATGVAILRGAVSSEAIDAYLREYEFAADHEALLVTTPGINGGNPAPFERELSHIPGSKIVDTGMLLRGAARLCFAPRLAAFLETLFEDKPLAFQTLHFEVGSTQGIHQDTSYVVVDREPMKLMASWIALEDIAEGTGELTYYLGGHRLPENVYSGEFKHFNPTRDGEEQHALHYHRLHQEAQQRGLGMTRFLGKKGDVLIWHADLPHGGDLIKHPGRTRRSLVTHYCPRSLDPYYFQFMNKDEHDKVDVGDGNAICSYYFETARVRNAMEGAAS